MSLTVVALAFPRPSTAGHVQPYTCLEASVCLLPTLVILLNLPAGSFGALDLAKTCSFQQEGYLLKFQSRCRPGLKVVSLQCYFAITLTE